MTSAIYSTRFFAAQVLAGQNGTFGPVPAGTVWILKSVQVQSGAAAGAYVSLNLGASGPRLLFMDRATGPNHAYWTGSIVLNAGESVQVQVVLQAANITVSGFSLPAVPGL
jgi:hypothetical protein